MSLCAIIKTLRHVATKKKEIKELSHSVWTKFMNLEILNLIEQSFRTFLEIALALMVSSM